MYDGNKVQVENGTGDSAADVVWKLCETLPDNENYKIYFDNYFTTFELQKKLTNRKIWSIGTLRAKRIQGCPLNSKKSQT